MEFWKNKVAIITGAGQGIGAQIAEDLVKIGMTVIGFEPTEEKVHEMMDNAKHWGLVEGRMVPCKCDISKEKDLIHAFDGIVTDYGGVDLLINNAAIGKEGLICTGDISVFKDIIDVNIYGLMACTRLAMASMMKKDFAQIININSICGHYMPNFEKPTINLYIASKRSMTAFSNTITEECKLLKHKIKVTSVSPGMVRTGIFKTAGIKFIDNEFFDKNPHLTVKDISSVVLKVLALPHVLQVKELMFHALHEIY
ncbi:Serine 3-dehydrogenase [Operophtera brumata]|uniref:Serine 3-dehydrogenase n=1 Tax=Operophtera brumata TaxID=104452 RepID=A0A0L7LD56_OPEBR|nr:Serine 3-dehydrogenase [Operophtera brumata]